MLSIRIQDCDNCGLTEMAKELDCAISDTAQNQYNHFAYLAPAEKKSRITQLLFYKSIMDNLYWNGDYYCYNYKDIISRIKRIIHVR